MLENLVTSIIRTAVPYITVWLVSTLALPETVSAELEGSLVVLAGTIWYAIARAIEQRYPNFGYVLGSKAKPRYETDVE